MQDACKSNLGHRLLYGLDEYFKPNSQVPRDFFRNLVRGSSLEQSFNRNKDENDTCIKDILAFLKRGGKLDVAGVIKNDEEVDCFRFCLKVLEIFGKVKVEDKTVIKLEEFWEVYARIAVQAFERFKKIHSEAIDSKLILYPLMDKFREMSKWEFRANILKGFKIIAFEIPERGSIFWDCCEFFLGHYEAASSCFLKNHEFPEPVRRGVSHLVDLWRTLATRYSSDRVVREKVIGVALRLLNLIDMARLESRLGMMQLNETLAALRLPTVDWLSDREPARDKETQMQLAWVGHRLIECIGKIKNPAVMEILDILLPYLYGRKGVRDRRSPQNAFSTANVQLARNYKCNALINNICGRTKRAFDITIDGITLKQNYEPTRKRCAGKGMSRTRFQIIKIKKIL